MTATGTALRAGLLQCHDCRGLCRAASHGKRETVVCPRCNATIHARIPHSISQTWALVVTAAVLFVPANTLPVMTVETLGQGEPQTIVGGVVHLYETGSWIIASLILLFSVFIPLGKLTGLGALLLSTQFGWRGQAVARARLYRAIEIVGRWSMLDIFVVAILVALVRFDALASIEPGLGASAFAAVVVLTMFASMKFDPRLMWDAMEESS